MKKQCGHLEARVGELTQQNSMLHKEAEKVSLCVCVCVCVYMQVCVCVTVCAYYVSCVPPLVLIHHHCIIHVNGNLKMGIMQTQIEHKCTLTCKTL